MNSLATLRKIEANAEWERIRRDGRGFVFNDFSGTGESGKEYNVLHSADCTWLARMNLNVAKRFSPTLEGAIAWLDKKRPGNWKACATCLPHVRAGKTRAASATTSASQPSDVEERTHEPHTASVENAGHAKILRQLLGYGETIGANELVFQNDPLVGDLVRQDPFGFLLAASVDRGMPAENAWRLPRKIETVIGHLDPQRIAAMSSDEMLGVLKQIDGKPRYLTDASKTIVELANRIVEDYDGNAQSFWRDQRAKTIRRRFESIYGVGPGIASMVVLLLDRLGEIELTPEDYAGMDPKPDVHVQRVFQRAGFCGRNPSEREVIRAARRIHPTFPGKLDAPAWHIGRNWCHAETPKCADCPMNDVCPKIL